MSTNFKKTATISLGMVLGCVTMLSPQAAFSQTANPNNITGRWCAVGNNTSSCSLTNALRITQAADGTISGSILGSNIEGFYLPVVRRLIFVRKTSAGLPYQMYEAWVSHDGTRMGGSFKVWNTLGSGNPANGLDFNFNANKASDTP